MDLLETVLELLNFIFVCIQQWHQNMLELMKGWMTSHGLIEFR